MQSDSKNLEEYCLDSEIYINISWKIIRKRILNYTLEYVRELFNKEKEISWKSKYLFFFQIYFP